jgi:hypothetical protein
VFRQSKSHGDKGTLGINHKRACSSRRVVARRWQQRHGGDRDAGVHVGEGGRKSARCRNPGTLRSTKQHQAPLRRRVTGGGAMVCVIGNPGSRRSMGIGH